MEEDSDFSEKSLTPPPSKKPLKESYSSRKGKRYREDRVEESSKRPSRTNQDRSRPSHHSFSKRDYHNRYDKRVKEVVRREERNVRHSTHHGIHQKPSKSTRVSPKYDSFPLYYITPMLI